MATSVIAVYFPTSCENDQIPRVWSAPCAFPTARCREICAICLSVSPNNVFVRRREDRQVAWCTDKMGFVEHSLPRGEWYHSSPLEAIYCCLCSSVSLYLSLSCTQQWSDWFSCGCLSVCRICLLSQVLYSACLPPALLPNSCRSVRILNSSRQITRGVAFLCVCVFFLNCRSISVLPPLDVRDTDKSGIYSTLWFLSLLVFTQGEPAACLPVSRLPFLHKDWVHGASFKWSAKKKKCSKVLLPRGHLNDRTPLNVFMLCGALCFFVLCVCVSLCRPDSGKWTVSHGGLQRLGLVWIMKGVWPSSTETGDRKSYQWPRRQWGRNRRGTQDGACCVISRLQHFTSY